jgi:hypothetical protein
MEYSIHKSDGDYRQAVNYDGTDYGTSYYKYPVTFTIDGSKYVLPVGSADRLSIEADQETIIIGENSVLDYISCIVIDLATKQIIQDIFIADCSYNEMTENIFDLSFNEQLQILQEYFI